VLYTSLQSQMSVFQYVSVTDTGSTTKFQDFLRTFWDLGFFFQDNKLHKNIYKMYTTCCGKKVNNRSSTPDTHEKPFGF